MHFLFTRSNAIGSRLIRCGLDEDTSHFALVFDEGRDDEGNGYGIVLHSSFTGVQLSWWEDFRNTHEIVRALTTKAPLGLQQEEAFYTAIVRKFYGKPYDYRAFAYFAYRAMLKKLWKVPIPSVNAWGNQDAFLCTGIAAALKWPLFDTLQLKAIASVSDMEMVSPTRLYLLLKQSPMLVDTQWIKTLSIR